MMPVTITWELNNLELDNYGRLLSHCASSSSLLALRLITDNY